MLLKINISSLKCLKLNKRKHKKSKWITFGIIKSINYRDEMYKRLKMTAAGITQFEILQSHLNIYNKILKKSIWLQKKLYYQACFKKYKKRYEKNMEDY